MTTTKAFKAALFPVLVTCGIVGAQPALAAGQTVRVGIMSGEDEDVGRAIADLDAAVVNTDWAIKAGIRIPQERIAQEKVPGNPYRNFIAVNEKDATAPWVKTIVDSDQQANVASAILTVYHGATLPAWDGAPQH